MSFKDFTKPPLIERDENTTTSFIGDQQCPHCGHPMTAATSFDEGDVRPSSGDATICMECTVILRFGNDLSVEIFPPEDLVQLPEDDMNQLMKLRRALKLVKKMRAKGPS